MAKKHRKRSKKNFTIPMALAIPVGVAAYNVGTKLLAKDMAGAMQLSTGFSGKPGEKWNYTYFAQTYGPIAAGAVVHWGANKFNVNKKLASAGIPVIRI